MRVAYRLLGPLAVEVDARFHCPDPRTIVMTIVRGDGEGSVVETHATPIDPGRTRGHRGDARHLRPPGLRARSPPWRRSLRPLMRWSARRLWIDDARYAERLHALRTRAGA